MTNTEDPLAQFLVPLLAHSAWLRSISPCSSTPAHLLLTTQCYGVCRAASVPMHLAWRHSAMRAGASHCWNDHLPSAVQPPPLSRMQPHRPTTTITHSCSLTPFPFEAPLSTPPFFVLSFLSFEATNGSHSVSFLPSHCKTPARSLRVHETYWTPWSPVLIIWLIQSFFFVKAMLNVTWPDEDVPICSHDALFHPY